MIRLVVTRIQLHGRWMDRACQTMFRGWKDAYEKQRGAERKLKTSIRSLDAARRSGHNDRFMLVKSNTQTYELQSEMM